MSQVEMTNNQMTRALKPEPHLWVERYADHLYSYAFVRLDSEEQARDLVQETFLAALEKVSQFQGNSSERTWLTAKLMLRSKSTKVLASQMRSRISSREIV